jgi:hypothetical protein
MAIDKLIPQYLNSDTDQKLVKSVEMTDNLNVRVSNDDEGTDGVVKNIKGTEVVGAKSASDAYPTGDNRVVGSVANEKNREVLFLLWNENTNHGIYRLDTTTGKYQKLYQDSVLNFKKFTHVECDVVVNEEGETLFYFTDGENPPMKVNINRLIKSKYPSEFYSGTDEEKLLSLTVAKQPPLKAPTFNFVNNPDIKLSNIYEKNFQFAYQYKYEDGEVSALSPYSTLSVSSSQLKDGLIKNSSKNFYNQIDVYVTHSVADVKEIILYARNSNLQTFNEVEKIDNNGTTGFTTISFTDDKISRALSTDEVNKVYDNVPQVAKAQSIVQNRLMYGNYKEGYENTEVSVESYPVHHDVPEIFKITVSHADTSDVVEESGYSGVLKFDIDFSEVPASLTTNHKVFLEFSILPDILKPQVSNAATYGDIIVDLKHPEDESIEQVTLRAEQGDPVREIVMSTQAIVVSKIFDFSQTTTRQDFIDTVSDYLTNNFFESLVSVDEKKYKYACRGYVKDGGAGGAYIWLGGVAFFGFTRTAVTSTELELAIDFVGAEVYVKDLEIKSGNWFTNTFLGRLPVTVLNSTVLKIGGLSSRNKYASETDVKISAEGFFKDIIVSGNASFGGEVDGSKTFKSDSHHSFGIVYLDDRGRASGVNKLDDVFVPAISERDEKGQSEIDFRIKNAAPSWAKKWMPVYAGNATTSEYIQYSTGEAYAALDPRETRGSSISKRIYVSMATLEGTEGSFKEQTGANLEYNHEKGDRLKILSYKDDNGDTIYPSGLEFNIVDYKYISEDDVKLFLNRTGNGTDEGWFLVLDDEGYESFSLSDIISDEDLWSSETIVEIEKPLKEITEKIYHSLGKTYDIVNGVHEGDRSVSSAPTATVTIDGSGGATSSDRLYVGDTIPVSGTTITITGVSVNADGTYSYTYRGVVSAQAAASYTIGNYQNGVVTVSQGDGYFRVRKIRISDNYNFGELPKKLRRNRYAYTGSYIEDASVSDYFLSKSYTKGKPYAHIPDAKTVNRISSITYSDAYVIDSDRLNLSSFNLSLANWTDLDVSFGGITSLVYRGDSLTTIQQSKASSLPVGRNLIEYTNGDAGVTVSKNVLGVPSYYAGDFGTSNPESVVERFGVVYYVDVKAAKVLRLSADGITPISDKGLESFFEGKFKSLMQISEKIRVVGGFDPDNSEYLITVEPIYNSTLTIGSDVSNIPVDANSEFTIQGVTYTSNTVLWNIWGNLWNTFCGDWDETGNGIVFVDSVFEPQSILVDIAFIGSTGTIDVLVTNSSYSFSAIGQLNLSDGKLTLPATTCEGTSITIGSATEEEAGFTIAYKHKQGVWSSKYSFRPTSYVNINNELYSFFDTASGIMWRHNVNQTRNNFYGTQYNSELEVVSNNNPSMVKVFEALGVEGNGSWSGVLTTSDQSTTIGTTDFYEREGHRYAMIFRDTLASTGHKIYLGKVSSVSGDKITFTTPINKIPFVIGDTLKTASGSTLTATSNTISAVTERKVIQCGATVSGISVNDDIFVEHTARVDGDPMRDVFLKIKLTSTDTTAFEVHALSVSYDRSMLHNDRVN